MLDYLQYPYSVAALIALVLLFWRPVTGLIFLVAIFPVDPYSPRLPVPGMNTETILLGVAFATTVLRFGARLPPLRYSAPVLGFVLVMLMGLIISIPWALDYSSITDEPAIWYIFKSWKSISFSSLLFFASYWWLGRPEDRQRMLGAISFGVWISAVVALLDFVFGFTENGVSGRAAGLQGDANASAEAIGSMMFVSFYLALYAPGLSLLKRLFHGSAYVLAFFAVVLSLSRGNWLALIAAHAVFFLLISRPLFIAMTATIALFATVAFPLLPDVVRDRIVQTTEVGNYAFAVGGGLEVSAAFRVVFAKIGYEMFLDSPIWGNGYGSFMFRAPELGARYGMFSAKDAHNIIIKLAAENGVIGLAAFAYLAWAVVRCGRWLWRGDPTERALGAVLLAAATHALVASLSTDSLPLHEADLGVLLGVVRAVRARVRRAELGRDGRGASARRGLEVAQVLPEGPGRGVPAVVHPDQLAPRCAERAAPGRVVEQHERGACRVGRSVRHQRVYPVLQQIEALAGDRGSRPSRGPSRAPPAACSSCPSRSAAGSRSPWRARGRAARRARSRSRPRAGHPASP